ELWARLGAGLQLASTSSLPGRQLCSASANKPVLTLFTKKPCPLCDELCPPSGTGGREQWQWDCTHKTSSPSSEACFWPLTATKRRCTVFWHPVKEVTRPLKTFQFLRAIILHVLTAFWYTGRGCRAAWLW
uniref:Uncharacterized protein n=1 Tax=Pavo cristatus TaxID=9049 RepID=A0A8C9EWW2_PAVCR